MSEVYLILDGEPLSRRSIILVENEEQAKALTDDNPYMSYEIIETLSDNDVKEMICDEKLLYHTDNDLLGFIKKHCRGCNVNYDEVCPYLD